LTKTKIRITITIWFFALCFTFKALSQSNLKSERDSIDIAQIENCFGFDILECRFASIMPGYKFKNSSRIRIFTNEFSEVTSLRFIYNKNPSLEIDDFKECLIPYIELNYRNGVNREVDVSITFIDEIKNINQTR